MNRLKYILLFIFILAWENTSAHVVHYRWWNFGNVIVTLRKEYSNSEEIDNKVKILGQMAESLAKQLNYNETILLDFRYNYYDKCETDCFISYDKGKIQYTWKDADKAKDILPVNVITIRQFGRLFDVQTTLKLLEYAILHKRNVKTSQKVINYCGYMEFKSIDTTLIKQILSQPNSANLDKVFNLKFENKKDSLVFEISYYLQNNKYTLFLKDSNLLTIDNIYHWQTINDYCTFVFDTDTSFYFINKYEVSNRHILQNIDYCSWFSTGCLKVEDEEDDENILIFSDIIKIYVYNRGCEPWKHFLYVTEEDKLIQDIDKEEIKKLINVRRNE